MITTDSIKCLECNSPAKVKFCSRSCSTAHNNKISAKKRKIGRICSCGATYFERRTKCNSCRNASNIYTMTFEAYRERFKTHAAAYNSLRVISKRLYAESTRPKQCLVCNYDRHYEVCHIKDLASFGPNEIISKAVGHTNIVALCPNHHWEFDSNLL